jgi:hypothetical protein
MEDEREANGVSSAFTRLVICRMVKETRLSAGATGGRRPAPASTVRRRLAIQHSAIRPTRLRVLRFSRRLGTSPLGNVDGGRRNAPGTGVSVYYH